MFLYRGDRLVNLKRISTINCVQGHRNLDKKIIKIGFRFSKNKNCV